MKTTPKAPWLSSYGDRKFNLEYPTCSISERVLQTADECPEIVALSYQGRNITFKTLKQKILETANAFAALGVKEGDKVTVCLPNVQYIIEIMQTQAIAALQNFLELVLAMFKSTPNTTRETKAMAQAIKKREPYIRRSLSPPLPCE